MVSHAVWKTWPSGLSNDKNLGLRPRFLSTESLGPCFSHGMGDHDQILQHGLEWGDGIDLWGYVMGAHDWIGEMGLICGDTPLVWDTGWDTSWGTRLDQRDGINLWGHAMGCDTGWMWVMRLIYGGVPWGRATGSGRWNWFVGANHGGARHWLDLGEGIDLCGRVMRAQGSTLSFVRPSRTGENAKKWKFGQVTLLSELSGGTGTNFIFICIIC